jgi:hypothetical protein
VNHRLSTEQVIALAPDSASIAAARKLASPASWTQSGADDAAIWGLAKGSGANPYQVAVDLRSGPAFKCSCPSRKIPCKHVLGLLMLHAAGVVGAAARPAYVAEWLTSRADRAEEAAGRAQARASRQADPEARAARTAKRTATIAGGLEDLDRFLTDLMREGLAAARERPAGWWDAQARALVDAQAPGLAERVRRLGATLHAGRPDWPARALEQAAMLYLVARGWRRGDALPPDLRVDLRAQVGWGVATDDVRATSPPEAGPWAVIGVSIHEQEQLRVRRTWLLRESDRRTGLLLDFAAPGGGSLPLGQPLGAVLSGAVHRYPGRAALRVLAGEDLRASGQDWRGPAPTATVGAALAAWSAAIQAVPLTDRIAVAVGDVVPVRSSGRWWLRDAEGAALPARGEPWPLIALAGGRPLGVAGEWNGETLQPLSAYAEGRTWSLV